MRVLFFALMIALLPLRGWVSDAMATSMAVAQLGASSPPIANAIKSRAEQADANWTSGGFDAKNTLATVYPHVRVSSADTGAAQDSGKLKEATFDCAGHAGDSDHSAASDACGACSACLTCHVSAVQADTAALQTFSLQSRAPQLQRRDFASADTALSQKPPIS